MLKKDLAFLSAFSLKVSQSMGPTHTHTHTHSVKKYLHFIGNLACLIPNDSTYITHSREHWRLEACGTLYCTEKLCFLLPNLLSNLLECSINIIHISLTLDSLICLSLLVLFMFDAGSCFIICIALRKIPVHCFLSFFPYFFA